MFFPFCVFIHTIDAPQLLHFTTRILRRRGKRLQAAQAVSGSQRQNCKRRNISRFLLRATGCFRIRGISARIYNISFDCS
jgi:hypothetical protein